MHLPIREVSTRTQAVHRGPRLVSEPHWSEHLVELLQCRRHDFLRCDDRVLYVGQVLTEGELSKQPSVPKKRTTNHFLIQRPLASHEAERKVRSRDLSDLVLSCLFNVHWRVGDKGHLQRASWNTKYRHVRHETPDTEYYSKHVRGS